MSGSLILGVDIGSRGAIALVSWDGASLDLVDVLDMPCLDDDRSGDLSALGLRGISTRMGGLSRRRASRRCWPDEVAALGHQKQEIGTLEQCWRHGLGYRLNHLSSIGRVSMRVSTTLFLAAMAFTLGFGAMHFQPASVVALMGQGQAGAGCTTVWVNTRSHVYHFDVTSSHGHNFYGNTRQGAYMCEADARAAGNRAAFDEHHP